MNSISFNNDGRQTKITNIHTDIIESHILTKMDGPTLASTSCACQMLHQLCREENAWRDICNSTWSSTKHPLVKNTISTFPGGHRSFFSDSFPIIHPHHDPHRYGGHLRTPELISALDIHYNNKSVYSKVDITNTGTDAFLDSNFKIELFDHKESVRIPIMCEEDDDDEEIYLLHLREYMTLSWIIIDPTQKQVVNVSSRRPVIVQRHWVNGDIELKFATMVAGSPGMSSDLVEFRIVAIVAWNEGGVFHLKKVNLQVKDMDNECLSGRDSLVILQEAMQSGKRKKGTRGQETARYEKYIDMKRERREGVQRRREGAQRRRSSNLIPALVVYLCCYFWRLFFFL